VVVSDLRGRNGEKRGGETDWGVGNQMRGEAENKGEMFLPNANKVKVRDKKPHRQGEEGARGLGAAKESAR